MNGLEAEELRVKLEKAFGNLAYITKLFCLNLRDARLMAPSFIADVSKYSEVPVNVIIDLEERHILPSRRRIQRLMEAYNASLSSLLPFRGKEEEGPDAFRCECNCWI